MSSNLKVLQVIPKLGYGGAETGCYDIAHYLPENNCGSYIVTSGGELLKFINKDKVKIIKSYVPEKVNLFIEKNLLDELKYFQKKYLFKIEILSDQGLIIPEYKIELFNKSKKLINTIENIDHIPSAKKAQKVPFKEKKVIIKGNKKIEKKTKKKKIKSKLRTLWTRRKKKN